MKRTVLIKLIVMTLILSAVTGCSLTSQEQVDAIKTVVTEYKVQSDMLSTQIAAIQAELLKQPDDDIYHKLVAKLTELEEKKSEIDAVIDKADAALAKIDAASPGANLEAGGIVLTSASTVLPPPYGAIAGIAGAVLAGLGGAWGRQANKAKTEAEAKYTAHKRGVEAAKMVIDPAVAKVIYTEIGSARDKLGVK
ncbi:MAG: hypothetical protein GY841_16515 [FCB group bacterium]|nr:hypothetical protein [FCB group bacterium]